VAFDFAFGLPTERTRAVYNRTDSTEEVALNYGIRDGGEIWVDPWPFGVEAYTGFIMGFQLEGYPDKLQPELLDFRLLPRTGPR
jgi:hypothetical protein